MPFNFRAIRKVEIRNSRLRDFTRSCAKTSVRLLNWGPVSYVRLLHCIGELSLPKLFLNFIYSFVLNIYFSCQIVLKIWTEHVSDITERTHPAPVKQYYKIWVTSIRNKTSQTANLHIFLTRTSPLEWRQMSVIAPQIASILAQHKSYALLDLCGRPIDWYA